MNATYVYNLGLAFENIVSKNQAHMAIKFASEIQISYKSLNALTNQVARFLLSLDTKRGNVIAIQNNKTSLGYATMLACLKIGAIYTNFDEQNPLERLSKIFATCQPKFIVTDSEPVDTLKETGIKVIDLSKFLDKIMLFPDIALSETSEVIGSDVAYIMFTSGSTGIPKGVAISHANLLNFISWARDCYSITSEDILTNVNPIYFDNSVFDFYSSIFNGATLAAFPRDIVSNPGRLVEKIDEIGCTIWFSVPSMLIYLTTVRALNKNNMKNIRVFSFGGEGYPKNSLKIIYDLYSDRAEFFNVYGPTECTCICSSYKVLASDFNDMHGLVTLGKLAPNFSHIILNEEDEGANTGELCLIGPQVGVGYYNDPQRTSISFKDNPLNKSFSERMYRTGDIVNLKDENLYFIGRKDNQIKHMGYRIELEEIEAAISCLVFVNEVAVIHNKSAMGLSRITAFIATDASLNEEDIRHELRKHLPEYMIPNIFQFMKILPKNANGKIDKNKLRKNE